MSFLNQPASFNAGELIDADAIARVALDLSALARSMVADFAGPAWIQGCEASALTDELDQVVVDVADGLVYPLEPAQAAGGAVLDLSVRSRQIAGRRAVLQPAAFHLVTLRAEESDELLGSIAVYSGGTPQLDDAAIPDGVVPLAFMTADFESVVSTHDMRTFPWEEISGPGGQQSVQEVREWLIITDTLQVVLMRGLQDEGLLLRFEADVTDNWADQNGMYPEVQFKIFDNDQPVSDAIWQFGTTRSGQLVWVGYYAPAGAGVHLIDMRIRGWSVRISDATLSIIHILGDRLPRASA